MTYRNVYFQINSGYIWGSGMSNESSTAFHQEVDSLFEAAGWTVVPCEIGAGCETVYRGNEELYLHPMSFSGLILLESIPEIETMLANAKTFRRVGTDLHEVYVEMTDANYLSYLDSRSVELETRILEIYRTKRSNLYFINDKSDAILKEIRIRRVSEYQKKGYSRMDVNYVGELIEKLVKEGKLIEAQSNSGIGYRSANKRELAALRRKSNSTIH